MDVIEKTQVKRAILVTSHYINPHVCERAMKLNTRILSKQLASEISIIIDENLNAFVNPVADLKKVDLVLVDDDERFAKNLMNYILDEQTVAYYEKPQRFLDAISQYAKDTPIFLDNNFTSAGIKGLDIAKLLHAQGYSRLYLLSGEQFHTDEMPTYLTVIQKDNINKLKNYFKQA